MVLPILGTRQSQERARKLGLEVYSAVQGNGSTGANKNALAVAQGYLAGMMQAQHKIAEYSRNPLGDEVVIDRAAKALSEFYHIPEEELKARLGFFVGAQQGEVAVALAIGSKLQAKDKLDVLVQVPGYPNYHRTIAHGFQEYTYYGSKVEPLQIDNEKGYATAEDIERDIKASQAKGRKPVVLLTIPSNPQGKSPPMDEMKRIAHMLDKYPDVYTIVDEAFLEMDFSGKFDNMAKAIAEEGLTDLQKRVSYSRTNTKAGGLPTERGNGMILPQDPEIVRAVSDYINITIFNSSVVAQYLLLGFLEDFHLNQEACVASYLPQYKKNFDTIHESLDRAGIIHSIPDAGFFTVLDFSSLRGMQVPTQVLEILRSRPNQNKDILIQDIDVKDEIIKTDKDIFNLLLFVGKVDSKEVVSALPAQFCGYAPEDCKLRFCFGMSHERLVKAGGVIEDLVGKIREYNKQLPQPDIGAGDAHEASQQARQP